MVAIVLVALLMAAAEPAPGAQGVSATTPSAAAAPAPAKPEPKPAKKVCWQEKPTGSHFSKEICATPDELEQMQHNAQDALSARVRPAPGGFGPGH